MAAFAIDDHNDPSFYVDSEATTHITNDAGKLSYIKSYNDNDVIYVGDENSLPISHIGEVNVNTEDGQLNLKDVLVVPDLKKKSFICRKTYYRQFVYY